MVTTTTATATVVEIEGGRYLLTVSGLGATFTVESTFGAISAAREWAEKYAAHFGATVKVTVRWME